ncbi:hypothetical protein VIGAN_05208100, partial [Vigna angularis var. angularis]
MKRSKVHLYKKGYMPNYTIWTFHGEEMPMTSTARSKQQASGLNNALHTHELDQLMYMQEMVDNAICQHSEQEAEDSLDEESSNETTQRFYNLLADLNKPVFDGSSESKLSVCIKLMACKSNWNIPNQAIDFISKLILELTPVNNSLSKNYYEAAKCVSKLGLEA